MRQPALGPEPTASQLPARPRHSLLKDIYLGAVYGDFAMEKGIPGSLVQAGLGYIPFVGSVCAARDVVADARDRDAIGVALNVISIFPVFGGFSKTIDVIHSVWRYRRKRQYQANNPYATAPRPRRSVWRGIGFSLLFIVAAFVYGVAVRYGLSFLATAGPAQVQAWLSGFGLFFAAAFLTWFGLIFGEVLCIINRAWLGMLIVPITLLVGLGGIPGVV